MNKNILMGTRETENAKIRYFFNGSYIYYHGQVKDRGIEDAEFFSGKLDPWMSFIIGGAKNLN